MKEDVYSDAINYVAEFYNITRKECVEYYWDEVESMMTMFSVLRGKDDGNLEQQNEYYENNPHVWSS